jgi:hypothetical protein
MQKIRSSYSSTRAGNETSELGSVLGSSIPRASLTLARFDLRALVLIVVLFGELTYRTIILHYE